MASVFNLDQIESMVERTKKDAKIFFLFKDKLSNEFSDEPALVVERGENHLSLSINNGFAEAICVLSNKERGHFYTNISIDINYGCHIAKTCYNNKVEKYPHSLDDIFEFAFLHHQEMLNKYNFPEIYFIGDLNKSILYLNNMLIHFQIPLLSGELSVEILEYYIKIINQLSLGYNSFSHNFDYVITYIKRTCIRRKNAIDRAKTLSENLEAQE